jgi:hypothetical protein
MTIKKRNAWPVHRWLETDRKPVERAMLVVTTQSLGLEERTRSER